MIAIQPEDVRDVLNAWRKGGGIPDRLLALHCLDGNIQTRYRREWQLYRWLHDTTYNNLTAYRRSMCRDTPDCVSRQWACDQILAQVRTDFSHQSPTVLPELLIWSALYHRYVIPFSLPVNLLADAAAVSERQFRRYAAQGLGLLSRALQRCELDAVAAMQPRVIPFTRTPPTG